MTDRRLSKTGTPPRLALALLNRVVPDEEPLAGDLVEEFETGRSRAWFWRQVFAAIAIRAFTRSDEVRPLRLIDGSPTRGSSLATVTRRKTVNLSASPIAGIGGLGLLIMGALVTIVMPQAWWIVLGAMLAGIVCGVALIAYREP